MTQFTTTIDDVTLGQLVPLNGLPKAQRKALIKDAKFLELGPGQSISGEHDWSEHTYYLLDGDIELLVGERLIDNFSGGSEQARFALSQLGSSQVTARALTPVRLLRVNRSLLSTLLVLVQATADAYQQHSATKTQAEVSAWMHRLLESELFKRIPPANIQRIFGLLKTMKVKAGEVIVRQGEVGDYYYIVRDGRCEVTRSASPGAMPLRLAELGYGDHFGEESLLAEKRRNATVSMLTDGVLMRLAKEDFVELIKDPLLNLLNKAQADALVKKGATWLDVRLSDEHSHDGIDGSINIPLSKLREGAAQLDDGRTYIVYCNSGRRSAAAAFLLSERGLLAYVLEGGLLGTRFATPSRIVAPAVPKTAAVGPGDSAKRDPGAAGLGRPSDALARAEQRRRELEDAVRAAESEAASARTQTELACAEGRKKTSERLRELERDLASQVEPWKRQIREAKAKAHELADGLLAEHRAEEERRRAETENKINTERKRLEAELAECLALEEECRRTLGRAEPASGAPGAGSVSDSDRVEREYALAREQHAQAERLKEEAEIWLHQESERSAQELEVARKHEEDMGRIAAEAEEQRRQAEAAERDMLADVHAQMAGEQEQATDQSDEREKIANLKEQIEKLKQQRASRSE